MPIAARRVGLGIRLVSVDRSLDLGLWCRPGRLLATAVVAGVLVLAGCRSAPVPAPREMYPAPPAQGSASTADRIVTSARAALGVPYRYGGADQRGFDCSGLTSWAFAAAGVALPRTAADQAGFGRWVALDELAAGDLVFFSTADKPDHVGLVISAAGEPLRMIHASTSVGVIETDVLRETYWLDRLRFGRRVLPGG
jgi:cell wall-associated NlpC family hydrolase